ncbi:bifunctional demethylmenaquinone methyltransferase/2-methoxy-6-polyprenyl-1,4-benzoquinol methylase UbiE [Bacteroides sp.]|uniref:bifunctional demethylmenaquinone methyltransferase/2-methoxy-6-polyprenyl-1,4-benzoquinol methylase UbiE n=1 Tax=Bacteroides sp. TaxID=29523 RepID=UPI002622DA48|nr:bifunctional demethylmenaquinone methyltransferase/2-methoxy-6-polyprenyl-1,4-benzoquinol methylase UbiE [Bacteroides sp.]MDD3039255.1 bifunctional demethylmenaquinone methyltransferase/2-methoxy-6-polyprenyl-1,4-benzoquinol methylase UbiE [Bacteroides sp.]
MKPYNKNESKGIQVHRMFNNIAPYYDKICHILSFNIDRLWRKRLVKLVAGIKPVNIVDIATGTGDVAISMARNISTAQIVGIDLSEEMLKVAQQKIEHSGIKSNIKFLCEDAENLSLASNSFDVVTISFGIRNFENIDKGLSECYRILREGGSLFVMEFSTPKHKVFNVLYRFYSKSILPVIGRIISKDNKAYTYLPESIVEFYQEDEFTKLLQNSGFDSCSAISLSNGIAHIYIGVKPKI